MTAANEAMTKPFHLRDNFAPVFDEITATDLEVIGHIPTALNGRFLRNGANPQTGWSDHWFLGNGMIHGVAFADGKANWYRNRYVRTPLLDDPDGDPVEAILVPEKSAANTHVIHHAGKILALEEAHLPWVMTPELDTVAAHDFDGRLKTAMTAHPKTCAATGELLFFAYGIMPPFLTYHRVAPDGTLVQSEEITVPAGTMMHDFNITRNYVVFMDLPAVWDLALAEQTGLPIRWDPGYGARLGVMPREGSDADVTWYEIDPCYVFHPLNAFEDGSDIVLDVCRKDHVMHGEIDSPASLHRWRIHTDSGRVSETPLDDRSTEFPRVCDSVVGLPYRYGYAAGLAGPVPYAERYIKYDMDSGASLVHELGAGREGSEAVFVRDPARAGEDAGWLLSYVYNKDSNTSEVLILDAGTMDAEPVAQIKLPARVPMGFHGSWVPF